MSSALAILTTLPSAAGTILTSSWRWWRTQLVGREFAVAILVQLQQGLRSLGDFIGGELSISIEIEGLHKRPGKRWRWTMPTTAGALVIPAAILGVIAHGEREDRSAREQIVRNLLHKISDDSDSDFWS